MYTESNFIGNPLGKIPKISSSTNFPFGTPEWTGLKQKCNRKQVSGDMKRPLFALPYSTYLTSNDPM
jgi:hypothetical protein